MSVLISPYTTWKHVTIIAKNTAVPAINGGAAVSMTPYEVRQCHVLADSFPGHVVTMSQGNCRIVQTVVETNTVITSASSRGSGHYWCAPSDVAALYTEVGASAYDSLTLYAPNTGINCDVSGLTLASPGAGTPGHSFIVSADSPLFGGTAGMIQVHEWIHQVTGWYYNTYGYPVNNIDNPSNYKDSTGTVYTDTGNFFLPFLSDTMTGNVYSSDMTQKLGVPTAAWRAGRPVS